MEHMSNQPIKVLLIAIFKAIMIMLLLINLSCNNMNKEDFKVFGEEVILKDCKINIKKSYAENNNKTETVFFNGKLRNIEPDNYAVYSIYLSFKDSLVNVIHMENVFYGASDQINHFYIDKKQNMISVLFVGRESEIKSKKGFQKILIPIDDYFKTQNITDEKLIQEEKGKFFNLYGE